MRGGGAVALALAALVLLPPPPPPPSSSPSVASRGALLGGVAAEPPPPARPLGPGAARGDGDELPAELLVSEFLFAHETKTFLFHKRKREGPLSITVTPCTSSIIWSVALRPDPLADLHATPDPEHRDANSVGDVPAVVLPPPPPPPGAGNGSSAWRAWVAAAPGETPLAEFRAGRELRALRLPPGAAPAGAYAVRVRALDRDSFVQLFASLRPAAAAAAGAAPLARTRLRLRRRRRPGHRLTVRWEQSKVDPHLMRYCLVVNSRRRYATLCEARGELLSAGPPPPAPAPAPANDAAASGRRGKQRKDKGKGKAKPGKAAGDSNTNNAHDIIIGCVGKRTQYTVSGLVPGRQYHFDLFAVNRRTNLSLAYGNAELHFDARARPTALRDARPATVNLKSLDGRAAFRFKVPRPAPGAAPGDLLLYVMPCGGGAVDVRAHLQQPRAPPNATATASASAGASAEAGSPPGAQEVARVRVEGYAALRVPAPPPGARLVLRAATPNAEELRRVSALEVFATTRASHFPFPTLPTPASLHEYDSLRRCDSLTVGWLPSTAPPGWAHDPTANASSGAPPRLRYCVSARPTRPRDLEGGRRAEQCGLEARMRRLAKTSSSSPSGADTAPVALHCFDHDAALAPPPLAAPPPQQQQQQPATRAAHDERSCSTKRKKKRALYYRARARFVASRPATQPARAIHTRPASPSGERVAEAGGRAAGGAVSTQALTQLRPGGAYTVQLTVQRLLPGGAGPPLSYDLLPVHTKPSCA